MGLDIYFNVNNHEKIFTDGYNSSLLKHDLSRTFCNFMSRKDVLYNFNFLPELDQIGKITGEDISSLYEMENYPDDEWVRESLKMAESDTERQLLEEKYQNQKEKLSNNIDKIYHLVNALIGKLSKIDNLLELLVKTDYDTFDYGRERYFSDFNIDKGEGYIRNNLGQDLRNFKRFLEYAKERGTETVYFFYG